MSPRFPAPVERAVEGMLGDTEAARTTTGERAARPRGGGVGSLLRRSGRFSILGGLIGLVIISVALEPGFRTSTNIVNLLSENAPVGVMTVGMTFVILTGGFDLSVGYIYAGAATVAASIAVHGSVAVAFIVALALSAFAGLVNGVLVTVFRVNPFIATLGVGYVVNGAALIYSQSKPFIVSKHAFTALGQSGVGPVTYSIFVLTAAFIVGELALGWTRFGREIYAVGGNDEAARLAGVRHHLIRGSAYVLSGLSAGIAGILVASRLGEGQANIGDTAALTVIAMVVLGGTSLSGGDGAMWRSAIGFAIIAVIDNVFSSASINPFWELVMTGAILVVAVAVDVGVRHREGRRALPGWIRFRLRAVESQGKGPPR